MWGERQSVKVVAVSSLSHIWGGDTFSPPAHNALLLTVIYMEKIGWAEWRKGRGVIRGWNLRNQM